jgi:DNA-binding CsgD family transcriptional regulator
MFERHRAVCVRRGRLEGADRAQTAALRQAIHRAASAANDIGSLAGTELMALGSGSDRRRVAALILPLSPPRSGIFQGGPVVTVFLCSPESGSSSHVVLLEQLFDFTTRESQVACALLEGRSPKQTAARLGISVHTVRTHLKKIMETTYARRQAALVRTLSLSIPSVRLP